MTALQKIQALARDLNKILVERETQVEALLAALIAGVHVLLLGPPGVAKSLLAQTLCQAIDGARYFSWLLTKFSTPEELFGPISMQGLKKDQYRRVTTNKMPEAHLAFADELFKANSAILNALLTLINERKFYNDTIMDCPLLTCVGASNELPQGEELGALYDRFLLRFWVKPIEDDRSFIGMIDPNAPKNTVSVQLTLDDIAELRRQMETVKVPQEILDALREICKELRLKGINPSDRRWKSVASTLRAFALLRGNTEVTTDELEVLADMLWDRPEDRKTIQSSVAPRSNPLNLKAVEFLDHSREVFEKWQRGRGSDADDKNALQANGTLKEILKELDGILASADPKKARKLLEAQTKIREMRTEVVRSLEV